MEDGLNSGGLKDFFKGLSAMLTQPVTVTGRPLSPEELRKRRAAKARKRLSKLGGLDPNPQPSQFILSGMVEPGEKSVFAIDGQDFVIDDGTWVVGIIVPGALAVVKGVENRSGVKTAKSVVIAQNMQKSA